MAQKASGIPESLIGLYTSANTDTFFYFSAFFASCFTSQLLHGANLQRQAEQVDEAICIVMIIQITGGEGSQGLAV